MPHGVSCFVLPPLFLSSSADMKFLLLHDQKTDDTIIKAFFYEVYELYIKVLLNPFYEKNTAITSKQFDDRVRALGEKYLGKA